MPYPRHSRYNRKQSPIQRISTALQHHPSSLTSLSIYIHIPYICGMEDSKTKSELGIREAPSHDDTYSHLALRLHQFEVSNNYPIRRSPSCFRIATTAFLSAAFVNSTFISPPTSMLAFLPNNTSAMLTLAFLPNNVSP